MTAFGGVATGNIKAELQHKAKIIADNVGDASAFRAKAMANGIKIFADAVFEAISVKKIVTNIKMIKSVWALTNGANSSKSPNR